jgi:hypothetical protein
MKTGGIGGSSTKTGLHFEKRADFLKVLDTVPGYSVHTDGVISFKGKPVAQHLRKGKLYKYLKEEGVNVDKLISKRLHPDDAILVSKSKTLFVIEMKFQKVAGSVDEKLQTCAFKKKQYTKLMSSLGIKVEYIYILCDWFKKPEYRDVLAYIKEVGCDYCFNTIKLARLKLPTTK